MRKARLLFSDLKAFDLDLDLLSKQVLPTVPAALEQ